MSNSLVAGLTDVTIVGVSTLLDERVYFFKYSPGIDLFVAGLNVQSADIGNDLLRKNLFNTETAGTHVVEMMM